MKLLWIVGVILAAFLAEATCQRFIQPTFRPPRRGGALDIIRPTYRPPRFNRPVTRYVREAGDEEPLWLWKGDNIDRAPASGDHPYLPSTIDDIRLEPNRRYARSVDSPSAKRYGGGRSSSGGRSTGPTHPGYNRRNTRDVLPRHDLEIDPFHPSRPRPYNPFRPRPGHPKGPYPIYARSTRDVQFPGMKKPTYRDIIIPNWNPNVRTQPWQRIGGNRRHARSAEELDMETQEVLPTRSQEFQEWY